MTDLKKHAITVFASVGSVAMAAAALVYAIVLLEERPKEPELSTGCRRCVERCLPDALGEAARRAMMGHMEEWARGRCVEICSKDVPVRQDGLTFIGPGECSRRM